MAVASEIYLLSTQIRYKTQQQIPQLGMIKIQDADYQKLIQDN